ncbi:hypothetical protein RF11_13683 [Thelohanellus kitauei]|uniref:Uncharacterized protein n=1 Tax=Thelohanellus kitauei TaxID=669202 RepID=A0A0C2IA96_THEKT|nr:hypothetical protein RF11_13683 [Thelohanellus kitauei]
MLRFLKTKLRKRTFSVYESIFLQSAQKTRGNVQRNQQLTLFTTMLFGLIGNCFRYIKSNTKNNARCVVITDSVRFHKFSTNVDCFPRSCHEIGFLQLYPTLLILIKELFSNYQRIAKIASSKKETALFKCMIQELTTITRENCNGYYQHIKIYVSRSI